MSFSKMLHFKLFQYKYVCRIRFLLNIGLTILLTSPSLFAQYNIVDWGAYFSDDSTGWNFADDELIDDIKVDNKNPENIYVVGRTRSSIGTSAACQGNLLSYGKGDVMIAKGHYAIMQPTIRPLFDSKQFQEALNLKAQQ